VAMSHTRELVAQSVRWWQLGFRLKRFVAAVCVTKQTPTATICLAAFVIREKFALR
jgi:hypothetical protein